MYILIIQKHKTAHDGHRSQPSTTMFQVESTIDDALGELTETTVYVSIMTRHKSQRFIYCTEKQRDH